MYTTPSFFYGSINSYGTFNCNWLSVPKWTMKSVKMLKTKSHPKKKVTCFLSGYFVVRTNYLSLTM